MSTALARQLLDSDLRQKVSERDREKLDASLHQVNEAGDLLHMQGAVEARSKKRASVALTEELRTHMDQVKGAISTLRRAKNSSQGF